MSQTKRSTSPQGSSLDPGSLTLRQAADALSTSTTTLRKLIRQGRLPEAEKVKTVDGRVWSIPATSIPGIAERAGFQLSVTESIDLREAETTDEPSDDGNTGERHVDTDNEASGESEAILLESWRHEPVPSETAARDLGEDATVTPLGRFDSEEPPAPPVVEPVEAAIAGSAPTDLDATDSAQTNSTALESIGEEGAIEAVDASNSAPTLADVLDTALLEKLLGAKDAEADALVKAERQRTEYEALAARQLEVELRFADADQSRIELAERLHNEALARAIADARVTELRDQLQREITYAEAERYERRQALARETRASVEAAELRGNLGWWARRKLNRAD